MAAARGYLTIGQWRGAPIRLHWTLPAGAFVFGQARFVPGFWAGFLLIIFIHEMGHAILVRRYGYRVLSIDVHGTGGLCRWRGDPTAIDRARIAWGGVVAQALSLLTAVVATTLLGRPTTPFTADLARAFTVTNVWIIALNLIPVRPLDGDEAWKLFRLLRQRHQRRVRRQILVAPRVLDEVDRELAVINARERQGPSPELAAAVDSVLQRIVEESKKK